MPSLTTLLLALSLTVCKIGSNNVSESHCNSMGGYIGGAPWMSPRGGAIRPLRLAATVETLVVGCERVVARDVGSGSRPMMNRVKVACGATTCVLHLQDL
ncbi:hypothetical protein C1H46_000005 [Malus baccata]|uniref:Secreted protein n=1 Tax=Malus baccata TaxID=106549 RepID=A0A540NSR3_MALBA|nr:hypothetical protein C1H46_000005 [Malus baccata]